MTSKNELATKIEKGIETPMIILALLIIPVVVIELEIVPTNAYLVSCATKIDDGIWFAFLLEYLVLVSLYDDKVGYTKRSWLNLIILLLSPPLICPQGFALIRSLRSLRVLRIFRVLRFLRIVIALKRGIKPILDVLAKNSLQYVTLITILLIIFSGIAFCWLEHRVISIQGIIQGVWWAITTVTTVGYGDLYPESHAGRILAVAVMIIGIGFVAVLTANIASYFIEKDKNTENENQDKKDENQLILERLEELSKKIDEINRRLP
jgi:voltage-gated potassium channel